MSLTFEIKVGKKYAIYLPKAVVKAVGIKEGGKVLLRISGNTLIIETIQDPIQLALSGEKFASVTPEEVEAISIEEQERHGDSS